MDKYKIILIVILLILVLAAVSVAFVWRRVYPMLETEYWYEYPLSESLEEYTIDSNTILASLEQGQPNVFVTKIATGENTTADTIVWKSADFSLVASAFQEFIAQEPVDNWILHRIRYSTDCETADQGFHFGSFQYFTITQLQGQETRLVHEISVAPRNNTTNSFWRKLSPVRETWEPITQEMLLLTAEEALQIAERNGGSAARIAIENECTIDVSLAPGSLYDGWRVVYVYSSSRGYEEAFDIEIDPVTGDFRIIK